MCQVGPARVSRAIGGAHPPPNQQFGCKADHLAQKVRVRGLLDEVVHVRHQPLHGDQSAVKKGRPADQRNRLIGRTKSGITELQDEADGRPIRFFMTAGQVPDYKGALLGSLAKADWLVADRGYDADWFRDELKDKG